MFRSIGLSTLALAALVACNDAESLRQDQQQEQRELQQEQQAERRELQEEQAQERARAAEAARGELADQRGEVEEQRQELTAEARQLQETVALACQGTPTAVADTCPLDRRYITTTSNDNDGIVINLSREAGNEADFERRIECYKARASLRAATAPVAAATPTAVDPNACVFDLADVDVDVSERDGHLVLDLSSDVRARVEEIRAHARRVTASL